MNVLSDGVLSSEINLYDTTVSILFGGIKVPTLVCQLQGMYHCGGSCWVEGGYKCREGGG